MSTGQTLLPEANTTRLVSLLIGLTVAGGSWLLTRVAGTVEPALAAGLAGALLGLSILIRDTETPVGTAIATLVLPVAGIVGLVALGVSLREVFVLGTTSESILRPFIGQVGILIAVGMAAFGVVSTLDNGIGSGSVTKLWQTTVMALFGISVALAGLFIMQFDALAAVPIPGVDGAALSTFVYQPSELPVVIISFWVLNCLFVGTTKILIDVAPISELTPQTKQASVDQALARLHSAFNILFAVLLGLTAMSLILVLSSIDLDEFLAGFPAVVSLLAAPEIRHGLVAGITVGTVSTLLLLGLQFVTGRVTDTLGSLVPSLLAGASAVGVAIVSSPLVPRLANQIPETPVVNVEEVITVLTPSGVVLVLLAVTVGLLLGVLTILMAAGGMRYIPQQTAGSAIASGGLGVGAIAAGIYGGHPLVVFAVVATSVLVWDLGARSATTRAELGAMPSVQLEAVHTFSALGLAVGGVAIGWGLYTTVLGRLVVSGGTLMGLLASAVGMVILVVALRG